MSDTPRATLACLDLLGTTVTDDSVAESAFTEAIATQGIVPGTTAYAKAMVQVYRARGQSKLDIFRGLFPEDEARAQAANVAFERSFDAAVKRVGVAPIPGAEAAITRLRASGVRVCLVTGLSRAGLTRVLDTLNWWRVADLVLCPEDVGRGRPWPDLILTAALRLQADDVAHIAVVGDTEDDIRCGLRAGAADVIGVNTGEHSSDQLHRAGATHVVDSIADVPEIVFGAA